MNISQAAKLTGLSAKQIRDYEKRGLLKAGTRTLSGYRYYEESDLARLRFIRHSRDVGFSLQQIAQLLQLQDNPHRNSREVKQLTAQRANSGITKHGGGASTLARQLPRQRLPGMLDFGRVE